MSLLNASTNLPHFLFLTTRNEAFRPSSKRAWSRDVKNIYQRTCFLTGQKESVLVKLETHHLYGVKKYPGLSFSLFNGIVLERTLHLELHRVYGFETRASDFLLFIEYLSKQNRLNPNLNKLSLISWIKLLDQKLKESEGGL